MAAAVAIHQPFTPFYSLFFLTEMGNTGRALNEGIKSFVDNNVTDAIRLLTPLAAIGYEVAQLNLAYIYKVCAFANIGGNFLDIYAHPTFPRKNLAE